MTTTNCPSAPQQPRLLDRVRLAIRALHYSRGTEDAYIGWVSGGGPGNGSSPRPVATWTARPASGGGTTCTNPWSSGPSKTPSAGRAS
jgi:hypothetical protein